MDHREVDIGLGDLVDVIRQRVEGDVQHDLDNGGRSALLTAESTTISSFYLEPADREALLRHEAD